MSEIAIKSERRAFSSAVFIVNGDDVLLIKHKRLGLWLPPGGEREGQERPLETAWREAKEETGLDVKFVANPYALDGEPPGFLGYDEHPCGDKDRHLNFNFVGLSSSREVRACDEFDDHGWFAISEFAGRPNFNRLAIGDGQTTTSVVQCILRIRHLQMSGRFPMKGGAE